MRVVVIDRDGENRRQLTRWLMRYDCLVTAGDDPERALQVIASGGVALVVIAPAEGDDPEAWIAWLYRFRRQTATAMVPAILHGPGTGGWAALLPLTDGHLPKPLDLAYLKASVLSRGFLPQNRSLRSNRG